MHCFFVYMHCFFVFMDKWHEYNCTVGQFVNKGVDNFARVGGLGCKCDAREKDHVQNMNCMFTSKKYATHTMQHSHATPPPPMKQSDNYIIIPFSYSTPSLCSASSNYTTYWLSPDGSVRGHGRGVM